MSRSRKSDKPDDQESEEGTAPKTAPWACEVEFYDKPSFMFRCSNSLWIMNM